MSVVKPSGVSTYIYGVDDVNPAGKWPWQVSLFQEDSEHSCGGAIIADRWVLTTGHCIELDSDLYSITVVAGEHNRSSFEGNEQTRYVKQKYLPSDYKYDQCGSRLLNDIGLLELDKPFTYTAHVMPVCLSSATEQYNNCYTTGWGKSGSNPKVAHILQELPVTILEEIKYTYTLANQFPWITYSGHMCVYERNGGDLYQDDLEKSDHQYGWLDQEYLGGFNHDSGGPLLCQKSGQMGPGKPWYLVGLHSWGFRGADCRLSSPRMQAHIYTDVRLTKYLNWIRQTCNNCA